MKICCGGFNLGDGLELDGKTLKATGGGGGGSAMIVNATISASGNSATLDKDSNAILAALPNCVIKFVDGDGYSHYAYPTQGMDGQFEFFEANTYILSGTNLAGIQYDRFAVVPNMGTQCGYQSGEKAF